MEIKKCPICGEKNLKNLLNHTRYRAKHELFVQFVMGQGNIKHAQWLKDNSFFVKPERYMTLKVGKETLNFKLTSGNLKLKDKNINCEIQLKHSKPE
jgi:hypothetical protein